MPRSVAKARTLLTAALCLSGWWFAIRLSRASRFAFSSVMVCVLILLPIDQIIDGGMLPPRCAAAPCPTPGWREQAGHRYEENRADWSALLPEVFQAFYGDGAVARVL